MGGPQEAQGFPAAPLGPALPGSHTPTEGWNAGPTHTSPHGDKVGQQDTVGLTLHRARRRLSHKHGGGEGTGKGTEPDGSSPLVLLHSPPVGKSMKQTS